MASATTKVAATEAVAHKECFFAAKAIAAPAANISPSMAKADQS
jgi:hypothetical protein